MGSSLVDLRMCTVSACVRACVRVCVCACVYATVHRPMGAIQYTDRESAAATRLPARPPDRIGRRGTPAQGAVLEAVGDSALCAVCHCLERRGVAAERGGAQRRSNNCAPLYCFALDWSRTSHPHVFL